MVPAREPPMRPPDVGLRRPRRDPENPVEILLDLAPSDAHGGVDTGPGQRFPRNERFGDDLGRAERLAQAERGFTLAFTQSTI